MGSLDFVPCMHAAREVTVYVDSRECMVSIPPYIGPEKMERAYIDLAVSYQINKPIARSRIEASTMRACGIKTCNEFTSPASS